MRKSTTNSRASRRRVAFFALAALASLMIALFATTAAPTFAASNKDNPECPEANGNGCGGGSGNCGHNNGNGSGGVDNGTGNNKEGCGETEEPPFDQCENLPGNQPKGTSCETVVDVCENLPGNQPAGTNCNPVVDACDNIAGVQPAGTNCNPVVDACDNIAGIQPAGSVCTTPQNPGSSNTGGGGTVEGPTGVDLSGAAVDNDHEPTLGNAAAAGQAADGAEVTTPGAAPAEAVAAGADPVVGSGGSLPYTGASTWIAAIAGFGAMLLGMLSYREARRVSRRRAVAGAAA